MTKERTLAVIGLGPRGLSALECFVLELSGKAYLPKIRLLLFEQTNQFGSGQVYNTDQPPTNWINIAERILELDVRSDIDMAGTIIPSFPSYHDWVDRDFDHIEDVETDRYPPRSLVGKYLNQRFHSLADPLVEEGMFLLIKEKVLDLTVEHDKISILTNGSSQYDVDEVLLTIGHQPTVLDDQISKWQAFAEQKDCFHLFTSPYPLSSYMSCSDLTPESVVGIRGFGLAMIDVVRGIASNFGAFVIDDQKTMSTKYVSKYSKSIMCVPFSLDGLPPVPKPLNARIDHLFKPTDEQIRDFEEMIGDPKIQEEATSPSFLIRAFAPIAAQIYERVPNCYDHIKYDVVATVEKWLQRKEFKHPLIISNAMPLERMIKEYVGMSTGCEDISLDFCIGQVWRHCQPSIYDKLSFNQCSDAVFAEIIELDEKTKRYSYGPPVESLQQMLALVEAGVMSFQMANNPEVELVHNGWKFSADDNSIVAQIMIDSILDSPKIEAVNSPLVKSLLSKDLIEAVHDELGVRTDENGYVISDNSKGEIPIAVLGRLAKGTIIGVDSILQSFGPRPEKWATEAVKRHIASVNSA